MTTLPYTGQEFLASLDDGREVWIYGERVKNITAHPAFQNTARMLARSVDLNSLLERISGLAAHLLAADGAAVLTYRAQDEELHLAGVQVHFLNAAFRRSPLPRAPVR